MFREMFYENVCWMGLHWDSGQLVGELVRGLATQIVGQLFC